MAATPDSTVASGRARTSGNSIVIAGDRTTSRRTARRHSKSVQALKIALPLTGLAAVAIFAATVLKSVGLGPGVPDLKMPEIVGENLKMQNPHYEGFNADGGRYWVKAETAQQDLKSLTVVRLNGITGELTDAKKQKTNLVATRGLYDSKANILELYDSITVTGDGGLSANLTRATVKTKEGIITSDQPATVSMDAGQITSNQLTIRQKSKEYTFVDNVRTHLKPKDQPPATEGQAASKPLPFGKPGEPVDVAANRLDVDDGKKTALFSGGVVATQAGATLRSPELTVTYEGAISPQDTAAQPGTGGGTKVKQMIARDSVVLEQASGETATSRTALFDGASQVAVLEGEVVLTQGDDKKAVGDRAEYDQAAQTMVLTGPVIVTQGGNMLKGRRLVFNRTTGKLQLTATTGAAGAAAGRISAHFIKPASKPSTREPEADQTANGIPFGPTFKTDPNAPYDVLADRLDIDDAAKAAVFTGNVAAVQGDFTIRSAELTAFYNGNAGLGASADATKAGAASLTHIQARKKVSVLSKDGQTATGDWAEVDVKANVATLGGAVVLTQGKNIVRGTKLLIDMNTGEATIKTEPTSTDAGAMISSSEGDGGGQIVKADRPSAVFYPGEMIGAKKAKPAAATGVDGWQVRSSP